MRKPARPSSLLAIVFGVGLLACALVGTATAGTMPTTYTLGVHYRCAVTHDPVTIGVWQVGQVTFNNARTHCAVDTVYGGFLAPGWCQDGQLWNDAWLWEIDNEEVGYIGRAVAGPTFISDGTNPLFGLTFPAGTPYYTSVRPNARVASTTFDGQVVFADSINTNPPHIVDTSAAEAVGTC
jgi:hypothetical protein